MIDVLDASEIYRMDRVADAIQEDVRKTIVFSAL
jgi:hypothetical protein